MTTNRDFAPRARILVVEHEREIRTMIARMLEPEYACDLASGVGEARELLSANSFEAVVCDLEMPDGSGLELADELPPNQPRPSLVLVTDLDDPEVARRGPDLGVHGYVLKPFGRAALQITLINALARRSLEITQEAHTRRLEEHLQTIIDRAPMAIYAKDRNHRYVIANRVTERIAGLPPGGLIGKTDDAVMPSVSAEQSAFGDRLILDGAPSFERKETIVIGGRTRAVLTIKFPLLDDEGRAVAVCGMSPDITAQAEADRLRDELEEAQRAAICELHDSRLETVERLVRALVLHDPNTGAHVGRMAVIAAVLAQRHGLDNARVELLQTAALMHDVGKIGIRGDLLRKPGTPTAAERTEMERHTVIGHDLLTESDNELLKLAATIALTHHEHFDGRGYPHGLSGEQIPIEGRLVAVADVFDALLSDRSYRPAMTVPEAVDLIRSETGTHFDPTFAELLLDNLDEVLSLRA